MDSNLEQQINQANKFFLVPFLLIISIAFLFFSSHLIKLEYQEYFKYGQITTGNVIDTYWESSGGSPPTSLFFCKIKTGSKNYIYEIQNADNSFMLSDNEQLLIEQIEKGNSVKIKILNEKQVKILEWNKIVINSSNQFWNIFGLWLTIFILIFAAIGLLYKIYLLIIKT
jgi:hypothetical protein